MYYSITLITYLLLYQYILFRYEQHHNMVSNNNENFPVHPFPQFNTVLWTICPCCALHNSSVKIATPQLSSQLYEANKIDFSIFEIKKKKKREKGMYIYISPCIYICLRDSPCKDRCLILSHRLDLGKSLSLGSVLDREQIF